MKITDYKIASANTPNELEKVVKELIDKGWTPQGGINTFVFSNRDGSYAISTQAMIKN